MDAGVTTTDIMYEMALSNIAMVRYYKYADILPCDYHLSAGQIAVNDSAGITASAALGGVHGIVVPNVSLPASRALQQQLNIVPSTSIALLKLLQTKYKTEAKKGIYHDGVPPLGALTGSYRGYNVWVDPQKPDDMNELTAFVTTILGGNDVPKNMTSNILSLRNQQARDQAGKPGTEGMSTLINNSLQ